MTITIHDTIQFKAHLTAIIYITTFVLTTLSFAPFSIPLITA